MAVTDKHAEVQSNFTPFTTRKTFLTLNFTKDEEVMNLVPGLLPGIVSDDFLAMFKTVVELWLGSIIAYFGVVGNIVTIIVFIKMGFQETVNISLTAITFWDTIKTLCQVVMKMYGPIELISGAFAETWNVISLVTVGYLVEIAGYISGAIAAYVAVERCLCVSMPFKVKILLTRKVVTAFHVVISVLIFASYAGVYSLMRFDWVYSPNYNQSVAQLGFTEIHFKHPGIMDTTTVLGLAYPFVSFTVMCVCTVIIIYNLKKSSLVRATATNTGTSKTDTKRSARDRQVTKMLLVLILVYIITYIPRLIHYSTREILTEYWAYGRYRNMMWIGGNTIMFGDVINSSVNPIILFFMSSQFKKTLFSICSRKKK